jgi:hypothetical protein
VIGGGRRFLDVAGVCRLSPGASTLRLRIPGVDGRELLRGSHPSPGLSAVVAQRGRAADLIGFGWAGVYLMSERMRRFLEASDLTGWLARPVDIEPDIFEGPIWLLGVVGESGPTYSASSHAELPRFGVFLDPFDWDGSDFFCPANERSFLITARAAAALRRARLRNLQFECGSLEPLPASR